MELTSLLPPASPGESPRREHDVHSSGERLRGGWQLVREIGLGYDQAPAPKSHPLELCYPMTAERTPDGHWLIMDEPEGASNVPVRFQGRTMLVSPAGEVTFDTRDLGIEDACGCLMDQGRVALLRRTRWEILVVTPDGELCQRIDLSSVSKFVPRSLSWTGHSLLVVFLTKSRAADLAEVDTAGRLLWYLPQARERLGVPASMQLLSRDTILVADAFRHVVQEFRRDGSAEVRWGEVANPGNSSRLLSNPRCAREASDGRMFIADTNNHRVLVVDSGGLAREWPAPNAAWVAPTWVDVLDDDGVVVCDGIARTVTAQDANGDLRWVAGRVGSTTRHLSFPRSVQYLGRARYLIADTASNRVVEAGPHGLSERPMLDGTPLFWPRAAIQLEDGVTLIADGRRSRVLAVDRTGRVLRSLSDLRCGDETFSLDDPHDVRVTPGDKLLVVDSACDLVFETDWAGNVTWRFGRDGGERLADPHSAQMLPDGRILISDPGNHRVLLVDRTDGSVREITVLEADTGLYRLNQPRYAEVAADGTLVIVDTGNNRVLACDITGRLRWELSVVPDSPITWLSRPRWAHLINRDEVLVADHFHHRILHLVRT